VFTGKWRRGFEIFFADRNYLCVLGDPGYQTGKESTMSGKISGSSKEKSVFEGDY
jgi:hypothetical protein